MSHCSKGSEKPAFEKDCLRLYSMRFCPFAQVLTYVILMKQTRVPSSTPLQYKHLDVANKEYSINSYNLNFHSFVTYNEFCLKEFATKAH